MNSFLFRPVANEDLPFLEETCRANLEALHGVLTGAEEFARRIATSSETFWIVFRNGERVAWFRTTIEKDTFWISMLQVHPAFQRQGVGKAILHFSEETARNASCTALSLHTTADNVPASTLYARFGFALVERSRCTTADGVERDGLTFSKPI